MSSNLILVNTLYKFNAVSGNLFDNMELISVIFSEIFLGIVSLLGASL